MSPAILLPFLLAQGPLPSGGPLSSVVPPEVADLAFVQKLGGQVPVDAKFRDEQGRDIRLGDLVAKRPTILVLAYYRCPQLCTLVLNGLIRGLQDVDFAAGEHFEVVVVSFDPKETPDLAAAKKAQYLQALGRPSAEAGWHFLTGDKDEIDRVADAIGFHYAFDVKHDRYNHPSGVIVLNPGGKVSRYLFGIRYLPRDLRLGIVEASEGRVGSLAEQFLLFCFHYDRETGSYALSAVRLGGAITVVALGVFLIWMWRREVKRPVPQPEATG